MAIFALVPDTAIVVARLDIAAAQQHTAVLAARLILDLAQSLPMDLAVEAMVISALVQSMETVALQRDTAGVRQRTAALAVSLRSGPVVFLQMAPAVELTVTCVLAQDMVTAVGQVGTVEAQRHIAVPVVRLHSDHVLSLLMGRVAEQMVTLVPAPAMETAVLRRDIVGIQQNIALQDLAKQALEPVIRVFLYPLMALAGRIRLLVPLVRGVVMETAAPQLATVEAHRYTAAVVVSSRMEPVLSLQMERVVAQKGSSARLQLTVIVALQADTAGVHRHTVERVASLPLDGVPRKLLIEIWQTPWTACQVQLLSFHVHSL
jgi:hypothetical protein